MDREELLLQTRRLRRLARGLLYDRDRADDVVQDAWLAALRQAPPQGGALKAWLAGTVRRLVWNENRSAGRRAKREAEAARPEAIPSTVDTNARVEAMRSVVDAVSELEEPYRETLLLRFFDELPPREVAKRQGVPVETVRTRTKRALARLRRQLDQEHGQSGGRSVFLAALLPLAGPTPWWLALGPPPVLSATSSGSTSPPIWPSWTGALAMSKTIQISVSTVLVALAITLGVRTLAGGDRPTRSALNTTMTDPAAPLVVDNEPRTDAAPEVRRNAVAEDAGATGAWVVRGRVSLGIGDSYPNVPVVAEVYEGRIDGRNPVGNPLHTARLQSDAEGSFEWALPAPPSTVTVLVRSEAPEHFNGSDWAFASPEAAPQTLQARAFPIDSHLVGRAVDTEGRGVSGAYLSMYFDSTETDAEGRFRIPTSSYITTLHGRLVAPGFAETEFSSKPLGKGRGGRIEAGDIVLETGALVAGRVVDTAGRPLADACVASSWTGLEERPEFPSVRTDADGRFAFDQLDPQARRPMLVVEKEGYARNSIDLNLSEPGELDLSQLEIVLSPGSRVLGRVRHEDGTPARNVSLTLGWRPHGEPRLNTYSSEEGTFEFAAVPPGTETLWAVADGYRTAQRQIEVPSDGTAVEELELVLEKGHWIGGQVVDERGTPVPWVLIYYTQRPRAGRGGEEHVPAVSSGPDGRFRLAGLPPGPCELGFLRQGYARHEESVSELDKGDLVVSLPRVGGLAGRVLDGQTGEPVKSFTIRLVGPALEPGELLLDGYTSRWVEGQRFQGTDGYWHLEGESLLPDRMVGVEVSAPGYGPTIARRCRTTVDPDRDELVFHLEAASSVRGRVLEAATGRPVVGAKVKRFTEHEPLHQQAWQGTLRWATQTDSRGEFLLENLPAESMSLAIEHPDWSLVIDGPFEIEAPGSRVERLIHADGGRTLTGRVLDASGQPLAEETIQLQAMHGGGETYRKFTTQTDASGEFSFANVLAGVFHVAWIDARGDQEAAHIQNLVVVEESGPIEPIVFQLAGRSTVYGTLRLTEAELPRWVVVRVRPVGDSVELPHMPGTMMARQTYATFAEDGRFSLERLPAGTYRVSAYVPDPKGREPGRMPQGFRGTARFELAAGEAHEVTLELAPWQH